jgi:hypothetical protein
MDIGETALYLNALDACLRRTAPDLRALLG